MIAPDYETLYAFEDALDAAIASVLTSAGLKTFTQRSTEDLVTPRAEVQTSVGAGIDHMAPAKDGQWFPDRFNGVIRLRVVTDRKNDAASHSPYRSKIRKALYRFAENFPDSILPYHEFLRVIEQGTAYEVNPSENEDASVISFTCVFAIRPDAWPHSA